MVLLLKTPPRLLRFQLLVGLLLALGTAPEGSEGKRLKCYRCPKDVGCTGDNQFEDSCADGQVCYKESGTAVDATKPRGTYKGCIGSHWDKCVRDKSGDSCGTFRTRKAWADFNCDKYSFSRRDDDDDESRRDEDDESFEKDGVTMCLCDTDLCNPAGHPTSNKMLTFAIVILLSVMMPTIYGGVAGPL